MPDTYPLPQNMEPVIHFSGVLDYDKLFKEIKGWYATRGFEYQEKDWKHKVPNPDGVEHEIELTGASQPTEYVLYNIHLSIRVWDLKEVDVVIDGQKKKMAKAKIKIRFGMHIDIDYKDNFQGKFQKNLQRFLHGPLWGKRIWGWWFDDTYMLMYNLHKHIKKLLNMSTTSNAYDIRLE